MRDPATADIGPRLKDIRERLGLTLIEMRELLIEHGLRLSFSNVNRMELGTEMPTVDELRIFAALDPLKRGRLWLVWGDPPPRATPKSGGAPADDRKRERVVPAPARVRRAR